MVTINLFGASGHAKVIMDIVQAQGDSVSCLYDDAPRFADIHGTEVRQTVTGVTGPLIIAVGSNGARRRIVKRLGDTMTYARAIHPTAVVASTATIDVGSVVMHGAIVQSDARIGRHCIINTGASVDHECRIGDFVHISPHATLCGNVVVGDGSWIGAGATVVPGIRIGKDVTVGAGAVVISDIPEGKTVVGIPARDITDK